MSPDPTPADRLESDERAAIPNDPHTRATVDDLHRLSDGGQPPDPRPEFRPTVARRAAELDAPVTLPAAAATPTTRGWLIRHRWKVIGAGLAGLAAGIAVAFFVGGSRGRGEVVDVGGKPIAPVVWTSFVPTKEPRQLELPKADVGYAERPVSRERVMGDERTLSDAQRKFGEWVIARQTLEPRVIINGQSVPLKQNPSDPIQQEEETGYECSGTQFVTKTRRTVVVARQVAETLFAVQDVNVFPGLVFNGRRYMATGELVRPVVPRGTFAAQKLTVFGPPLNVEGTVDTKKAIPADLDARRVKLTNAGELANLPKFEPSFPQPEVKNPASRQDYEGARQELLPLIGKASYFSLEVDTARCKEEFEFKAGLKVSGGFGNVFAGFQMEEREEHGMVFARGVEVAYTVAVDDRPDPARWVNRDADVSVLTSGADPLMYVSEVVYGRAWMVVATSSLSTAEMKAVFNGTIETVWATLSPDVVVQRKKELANTTVKVFNLGGTPNTDTFKIDLTDYKNVPAQILKLQEPALTPRTAMPIAYRVRWLADKDGDTPAGWVGVVPMRTYTQQKPEDVKFDLVLRHYNVRKGFGGFLFFGGGGKLNIGTRVVKPDGTLDAFDPNRRYYGSLDEKNYQNLNHPLVVGQPVPAPEFKVLVRQAELGGGIGTWEKFAERGGDGFSEQSLTVNVHELLKIKDKAREEVLRFAGDGPDKPNEVTVRVSIQPPRVQELPAPKPMPNVGGGGEAKAK